MAVQKQNPTIIVKQYVVRLDNYFNIGCLSEAEGIINIEYVEVCLSADFLEEKFKLTTLHAGDFQGN